MINRHLYDSRGFFVRTIQSATRFDSFPPNSTTATPPALQSGEHARWNNTGWEIVTDKPELPATIPKIVSAAQLRIALKRAGKLNQIKTYIQGLAADSEEKIWIDLSADVRRESTLSGIIQSELSLTNDQMDQLFTIAAEIG